MTTVIGGSADHLYRQALQHVTFQGHTVSPREQKTTEVIGAHLVLTNPYRNIITTPERKLNYHFMVAEWLWIMLGMNDLDMIRPYNKQMAEYSDDGETLRGAYGPKLIEQLPYVLELLRADMFTRQAVISLWRERPRHSKDIPCTLTLQFLLRERGGALVLDLVTNMRSNDVWLGLPYDLFTFTMIQQYVAGQLNATCGTYHHFVGSFHLYERHAVQARELIEATVGQPWEPRDHVTEYMFPLPAMPPAFRAMFLGLTLMAKSGETMEELKEWLAMTGDIEAPWGGMLKLLGHRFHKDNSVLVSPWKVLLESPA